MKERDFIMELARSAPWTAAQLGEPLLYTKIPDLPRGPGQRFLARRGYDCFLVYQGRHIALEAKMAKTRSLGFDCLDDYQEDCLHEVEEAGGTAFVVVNFRLTFSKTEAKKRGTDKVILAFALPAFTWPELRAGACRASLPLEWFEANAIRLPKVKTEGGIGWDLRPVLGWAQP